MTTESEPLISSPSKLASRSKHNIKNFNQTKEFGSSIMDNADGNEVQGTRRGLHQQTLRNQVTTETSLNITVNNNSNNTSKGCFIMRSFDDILDNASKDQQRIIKTKTNGSHNQNLKNISETGITTSRITNDYERVASDQHENIEESAISDDDRRETSYCGFDKWRYYMIFISLGIANSSDASEILCLSYILSDKHFQNTMLSSNDSSSSLFVSSSFKSGVLAATVFLGMLLGGLFVGCFGDLYGRRTLLQYALMTGCVTGLLSAICPNIWILSICRFIAGLGIGATVPPLFALCSELSSSHHRGYWISIVASFWMIGSIYVAIIGWIILGNQNYDHEGQTNIPTTPSQIYTSPENNIGIEHGSYHRMMASSNADNSNQWRLFAALCALPSGLGSILVHRFVPESPRFLLLQGRHEEALSVINYLVVRCLNYYHGSPMTLDELHYHYPSSVSKKTTTSPRMIDPEMTSSNSGLSPLFRDHPVTNARHEYNLYENEAEISHSNESVMNPNYSGIDRNMSLNDRDITPASTSSGSCCFFFHTAATEFRLSTSQLYQQSLRSTTFPLQVIWFSLSFGSYGILTWINTLFEKVHLENIYFNALLFSLSNLPGNLISAYCMDRIGRTRLLTGSMLLAALSLVSFAYEASSSIQTDYENNNELSHKRMLIVISACAFQCFTIIGWNTIDVLTSELFPTSVRSTGMGVCAASGRIGAMIAQFINGSLISNPSRLLLVSAGTLILGSITPTCLPADQTGLPIRDYTTTDHRNDTSLNQQDVSNSIVSHDQIVPNNELPIHNYHDNIEDIDDCSDNKSSVSVELSSSVS